MKRLNPVPSDLEIAQAAELKPILDIAASLGLAPDDLDLYGKYKAKVHLDVLEKFADRPQGKYVDVTAITPTPLGEGKTTTTIGLSSAAWAISRSLGTGFSRFMGSTSVLMLCDLFCRGRMLGTRHQPNLGTYDNPGMSRRQ